MKTTMKLPVKLTASEIEEITKRHSDEAAAIKAIDDRKRDALADFRHEKKPHVDEFNRLDMLKSTGVEERDVECEEREVVVEGDRMIETIRLDTGERVGDLIPCEPEGDERQPALPFDASKVPELRCTAIDVDGVAYSVTAEMADGIERELASNETHPPMTHAEIDGATRAIIGIKRGTACPFCGIVAPHHRPECKGMQAEDAADADEGDDAGLDTAQVAQALDAGEAVEGAKTQKLRKVKPKRKGADAPAEAE